MLTPFFRRWTQSTTPSWFAPAVAGVAVVVALLTTLLPKQTRDSRSLFVGLACIGIIVLAWLVETGGLRWPRPAFVAIVIGSVAALLALCDWPVAPVFLLMVVTWVTYVGTRRESICTLGLAVAALFPLPLIHHDALADWLPWALGMGYSWVSAHALATQQRLLIALRTAQADLARQSAAEERRRIAREVHDVIAHSLAVTMLHLTGARHILARDQQGAAAALAQAEHLGRQSLADIRRTVGLLGSAHDTGTVAPLPSASDIPDLVAGFARAGLDVHCHITGDPGRLSAAAGLDLYRITQEALTNVAKHAPGAHTEVELAIGEDAVLLSVCNGENCNGASSPAAAAGSGLGLAGMRERAALLGGSLTAQYDGAGWRVECMVPLDVVGLVSN